MFRPSKKYQSRDTVPCKNLKKRALKYRFTNVLCSLPGDEQRKMFGMEGVTLGMGGGGIEKCVKSRTYVTQPSPAQTRVVYKYEQIEVILRHYSTVLYMEITEFPRGHTAYPVNEFFSGILFFFEKPITPCCIILENKGKFTRDLLQKRLPHL